MVNLLLKISDWLRNPCKFRHRWVNKNGQYSYIRSAERDKTRCEVLLKNPDGGWLRYERCCVRCSHRQYLKQLDFAGTRAKWADV